MGARDKLNAVFVFGSLVVAGVLGLASGSGVLFILVAIILVGLCMNGGGIRLKR